MDIFKFMHITKREAQATKTVLSDLGDVHVKG
jgi:hypothetical protein